MSQRVAAGWLMAALWITGCGPTLMAVQQTADSASGVRVVLTEVTGNLVRVRLDNYSAMTLVVDRDAMVLVSSSGAVRGRMPGGAGRLFSLPPGYSHEVYARFDLVGLQPGDRLSVSFSGALSAEMGPVRVPPLPLAVN
jgi:hypothetical protein